MAPYAAFLLLGLLAPAAVLASWDIDEDVRLDTIGLLTKYGYPAEVHEVTTDDGYILSLHRVPYSPVSPLQEGKQKPVVFLQHGLLCSSADWVVMGPGAGFVYILADAGYDVWMGNARGNTYSRRHIKYKPNGLFNSKFWNFDWHEVGLYDLPASIDYVLEQTGEEKLFYAGHSMGTTAFWVMTTQRPEYNDKIRAMFALAPIAYMGYMTSPFFQLLSLANKPLEFLLNIMGVNEFLPNNELMTLGGKLLCQDKALTQFMCENVLFLIAGYDSEELNSTMLPVILGHTPAGASTNELLHYAQEIVSFKFRQWDYTATNLFHYGSLTPPKYKLSKVTAPVALFYSGNDWLAAIKDVDKLYSEISNPIGKFKNSHSKFNHLDYLWAIRAKELVYDQVLSLMTRY
ncbi:hypothetical protein R5R35_010999 [Gryllus longicercus]|uniref:Lipase n=2 Tax=Gryllus longicercus TaxID=2509291 RepID=A0AAN9VJQ9_9ORTH